MNSSVRVYKTSDADAPKRVSDEVEKEFVDIVKDVDGFGGYYLIDGGDGTLITITVAESQAAVEESAEKAAEWVKGNQIASDAIEGPPEITNGEVRVSVSA